MANNQVLKDDIASVIKTNGNNDITGALLQSVLFSIVNQFSIGGIYKGLATPSTIPGIQDVNVFYLATQVGVYPNFNSLEVKKGEIVIISNITGSWVKDVLINYNSIEKIEKTKTVGYVDTYTIFQTNGTITTFDVHNADMTEVNNAIEAKVNDLKTHRLQILDKSNFYPKRTYNVSTGELRGTSTNLNVLFKVPVKPNSIYIHNHTSVVAKVWYKADGSFGGTFSANYNIIPTGNDYHFITFYTKSDTNLDFKGLWLYEVKEGYIDPNLYSYLPPKVISDLEYYVNKKDFLPYKVLPKTLYLNENPNFWKHTSLGYPKGVTLITGTYSKDVGLIKCTEPYLLDKGIEYLTRVQVPIGGVQVDIANGLSFTNDVGVYTDKFTNKYIYTTMFLISENPNFKPTKINIVGVYGDSSEGIKISTLVREDIIKVKEGLYRIEAIYKTSDFLYRNFFIRVMTIDKLPIPTDESNLYSYYTTPLAYFVSDELYKIDTIFPNLIGEVKTKAEYLRNSVRTQAIDNWIFNKKVCLYGTSIEAGGYINKVANFYNWDLKNYGNGGGGITNPLDDGRGFIDGILHPQKCWSMSWAEKEAYLTSKGIPISSDSKSSCYDINLLGNLDADLYIIGTYGINDRTPWEQNSVVDKVNKKYNRGTIYGAYCYVLRKLFEAKPDAKVIILGQHGFGWVNTRQVNEIQREVAKDWCIPFIDFGLKMRMSDEIVTIEGVDKKVITASGYSNDDAHLTTKGNEYVADWLIRLLRNIY